MGAIFDDGWGQRDICLGGQFLERNIQQNIFQWECSGPAYLTPQLRTRFELFYSNNGASLVDQVVKNLPEIEETWV